MVQGAGRAGSDSWPARTVLAPGHAAQRTCLLPILTGPSGKTTQASCWVSGSRGLVLATYVPTPSASLAESKPRHFAGTEGSAPGLGHLLGCASAWVCLPGQLLPIVSCAAPGQGGTAPQVAVRAGKEGENTVGPGQHGFVDNMGLNCVCPLRRGFFPLNAINVFSLRF